MKVRLEPRLRQFSNAVLFGPTFGLSTRTKPLFRRTLRVCAPRVFLIDGVLTAVAVDQRPRIFLPGTFPMKASDNGQNGAGGLRTMLVDIPISGLV